MSFITEIKRSLWFGYYALKPFRASVALRQSLQRLKSMLFNHQGFRVIDLAIGYECNLSCRHCSAMTLKQNRETLTLEDYKRIVRQSGTLDNLSWNITGGEPLMVPWLDELIPVLEPRKHYISIQTNGMLLTLDRARELAALGVNCISVSLDSLQKEEHNRFRGNRLSFDRVISGIQNAQQAGMQVLVGTTVTHESLYSTDVERLIRFVNRSKAIFLFNLAVPCGNWKQNRDILLTPEDRIRLNSLLRRYPMTSTDHEPGRNRKGCPAGMEKIYITSYGDVMPCPFIHISFGNIRNDSLETCVSRMRKTNYFSDYQGVCIAAEDRQFHRDVMTTVWSYNGPLPMDYTELFSGSKEYRQ